MVVVAVKAQWRTFDAVECDNGEINLDSTIIIAFTVFNADTTYRNCKS